MTTVMELPEKFDESVGKWQERLLQLDRRNKLLYFKPESRQVLLMESQTSDGIIGLLESRGVQGASFDYSGATGPRARGVARFDRGETADGPEVILGDLRSDCPPPELQRRLGNLKRRQDEWEAEQGLPVLYLALGLLHWIDEDDEKASAPLLLYPCKLLRENPRSEFRLTATDDDSVRNETLSVKVPIIQSAQKTPVLVGGGFGCN